MGEMVLYRQFDLCGLFMVCGTLKYRYRSLRSGESLGFNKLVQKIVHTQIPMHF